MKDMTIVVIKEEENVMQNVVNKINDNIKAAKDAWAYINAAGEEKEEAVVVEADVVVEEPVAEATADAKEDGKSVARKLIEKLGAYVVNAAKTVVDKTVEVVKTAVNKVVDVVKAGVKSAKEKALALLAKLRAEAKEVKTSTSKAIAVINQA